MKGSDSLECKHCNTPIKDKRAAWAWKRERLLSLKCDHTILFNTSNWTKQMTQNVRRKLYLDNYTLDSAETIQGWTILPSLEKKQNPSEWTHPVFEIDRKTAAMSISTVVCLRVCVCVCVSQKSWKFSIRVIFPGSAVENDSAQEGDLQGSKRLLLHSRSHTPYLSGF